MDHIDKRAKEPHPRLNANIVSLVLFFYTFKLFKRGAEREIEEDDLYEVLPDDRSKKLGDRFESTWERQMRKKGSNSVLRLLARCFGKQIFLLGVTQIISKTIMITLQPHALSKIISYFNPGQTEMTRTDLYFWAGLLVAANVIDVIYTHNYNLACATLGIRIRAAVCSFLYRKALKLSPSQLGDISVGKIVNLITKDVHSLEYFTFLANDLWVAVLKALVVCFILYLRIGCAAFSGIGFILIMLPLQIYMGTWAAKLRMKMCKYVDDRLQITQETLSAIKIIKMYTWEKFLNNKVIAARVQEIKSMHLIFYLKFILLQIGLLNGNIAFYLILVTYKWLGYHITAEVVYYIDNCFHILSHSICIRFPTAISQIAEFTASIKRLGNVLKALELESDLQENTIVIKPKVSLKNVSVALKKREVLHAIDLNVDVGVTLIAGPVGSGKTLLMKTILKEFVPSDGRVLTQGRISYASQDPWLFPSSIKQNILFGERHDEAKYQEVLRVCALVYDLELLSNGDKTIVEDRGNNLSKGQKARINLARAVYKDSEIYLLDDCLSALDSQVSDFIFKECIKKFLHNKLVIFVSHNVGHLKDVDNVVVLRHGRITSYSKPSEISEKKILEEIREYDEDRENNDMTAEEDDGADEETKLITETTRERKVYQETKKKGEVEFAVYKRYLQFGGGIFALIFILTTYGVAQFAHSYADKLVSRWVNLEQKISNYSIYYNNNTNITDENQQHTIETKDRVFKIYTVMIVLSTILSVGRSFGFYSVMKRASLNLHKHMITHIVNATMHFFDTNFVGNILNRFSKDLTIIDEHLPFIYHQVFRTGLFIVGVMVLIATVNTFFLLPTFIFFGVLMILRRYYLKTARSLKRLDATTRSPVIGHLNATLEGLTTIRAFKAETILRDEYDRHQDLYTSASYVFATSLRAFAFCLDMLCTLFIATIIGRFVFSGDVVLAGSVGLAISQALRMTGTLQWGVRIWAEMENSMTSVERVLEYTEVEQESKKGREVENWPEEGEVKYENVCLSYTKSDGYVLKNINFTAHPKEKIGIVGRTGAGKSSIISTIFRLYEVEGNITIDGADIKLLPLEFLRKHISIIPQDPVLFTGSVRDNIDPEGKYSDEEIWKAVETAHLKKTIPSLDFAIAANDSNFSVGEKQLICLARAIIRDNKIVVLDEATANMDPETDALIHKTINNCFGSCTVFTIAHKLQSVIDCDKIVVMDRGEIVEYDDPKSLLQIKDGRFYKMARRSGFLPAPDL